MAQLRARIAIENGQPVLDGEYDDEMTEVARQLGGWKAYPRGSGLSTARAALLELAPDGWKVADDYPSPGQPSIPPTATKVIRCASWGSRSRDALSAADLYLYKDS